MADDRLAILVPDGTYLAVLRQLFEKRCQSLGIRKVGFDIIKDAFHDSSPDAAPLLRPYLGSCTHALVFRDLHGSGAEAEGAEALEKTILAELRANGWTRDKVEVIVVDPEIEAWLRFDSTRLADLVQKRARRNREQAELLFPTVRNRAIVETGGMAPTGKPKNPKEAFEAILREFGIQRSNSLYGGLTEKESLQDCASPSFQRLVTILRRWFPVFA